MIYFSQNQANNLSPNMVYVVHPYHKNQNTALFALLLCCVMVIFVVFTKMTF